MITAKEDINLYEKVL